VPFVSPVTVRGLGVPVTDIPPGLEITVYREIGIPPSDTGGVKLTVACVLPARAVTPMGAPGREAGVTALEAVEGVPVPLMLLAATVNV
jgi:hypothetical protein